MESRREATSRFFALHFGREWHIASFQARLKLVEVEPEADIGRDVFLPSSAVGRYHGRDWALAGMARLAAHKHSAQLTGRTLSNEHGSAANQATFHRVSLPYRGATSSEE